MNVDQGDQVGFRCFLIPVETCRKVTSHLKGGDLFPNGEASGSSEGLLVSGIVYTEVETGVKDASCNDFM